VGGRTAPAAELNLSRVNIFGDLNVQGGDTWVMSDSNTPATPQLLELTPPAP
jgi:hypothetical protein